MVKEKRSTSNRFDQNPLSPRCVLPSNQPAVIRQNFPGNQLPQQRNAQYSNFHGNQQFRHRRSSSVGQIDQLDQNAVVTSQLSKVGRRRSIDDVTKANSPPPRPPKPSWGTPQQNRRKFNVDVSFCNLF